MCIRKGGGSKREIYTTEGANFYIDYIREKETAPRSRSIPNQTAREQERERARKGIKRKRGSAAAAAEPLYIFYVIVACLCVKRRRERNYYTAIANYTLVLSLVGAPAFGARNRNGKEDALTRSSRAFPPSEL